MSKSRRRRKPFTESSASSNSGFRHTAWWNPALASTIIPLTSENTWITSPLSTDSNEYEKDFEDGIRIPLPLSSTSSESGNEVTAMAEEVEIPQMEDLRDSIEDRWQIQDPVQEEDIPVPMIAKEDAEPSSAVDPLEVEVPDSVQVPEIPIPPVLLEDLLQMVRKEAYESRSLQLLQEQTHQLIHRCAVLHRNAHKQFRLHHRMIEQFRLENRRGFDPIFKESIRVREIFSVAPLPYASPVIPPAGPAPFSSSHSQPESWIHRLSTESSEFLKYLLYQIRSNPEFLARRITNLSSSQLGMLGRSQQQQVTVSSVISPQRYKFGGALTDWGFDRRESASGSFPQKTEPSLDDPLSLLLHTVFDESFEQNCTEYLCRGDIWSTVCAQVILDGKQGSEEFALTILDDLARTQQWPLIPQLELFLAKLVQDGASILDSSANQRIEFGQKELANARVAIATSEFFNNATRTFLSLVAGGLPKSIMPDGLLDFTRSILKKIPDPEKRSKAKTSIVRWYTGSFLSNALIYPENHGMMMRNYLSKEIRQKLLEALAARVQGQVFDVLSPWSSTTPTDPIIEDSVRKLLHAFENVSEDLQSPIAPTNGHWRDTHQHHLLLGPQDVISVCKTLFPENPATTKLEASTTYDYPSSAVSSSAGSSTLTSQTIEQRTSTASSNATSFSGVFVSTDALSGETQVFQPDHPCNGAHTIGTVENEHDEGTAYLGEAVLLTRVRKLLNESTSFIEGPTDGAEGPKPEKLAILYIKESTEGRHSISMSILDDLEANTFETQHLPLPDENSNLLNERSSRIVTRAIERLSQESISPNVKISRDLDTDERNVTCPLESQLESKMVLSKSCHDFHSSHFWWTSLTTLRSIPQETRNRLLQEIVKATDLNMKRISVVTARYDSWLYILSRRNNLRFNRLCEIEAKCEALRDKLWYILDVRHSSPYEDASNVSRALRTMAKSPPPRATGMRAWASHRLRSSIGHDRAQMQTFETLSADKAFGGPSKLTDQQAERTSRWLTEHSIENFCKGEERIHRFCLEMEKCINKLVGENLLKSPVLWSSSLYEQESQVWGGSSRRPTNGSSPPADRNAGGHGPAFSAIKMPATIFRSLQPLHLTSMAPQHSLYYQEQENFLESSSFPYATLQFGSSFLPLGLSSFGRWFAPGLVNSTEALSSESLQTKKQAFLDRLKETVTSLLLSDLGYGLWNLGTETDRWVNDNEHLRQEIRQAHDLSKTSPPTSEIDAPDASSDITITMLSPESGPVTNLPSLTPFIGLEPPVQSAGLTTPACETARNLDEELQFPYEQAYEKLLAKFALSSDPFVKISALYEMSSLIKSASIVQSSENLPDLFRFTTSLGDDIRPATRGIGKPRTRATKLEEVMANCEERRRQPPILSPAQSAPSGPGLFPREESGVSSLDLVPVFKQIFNSPSLRPKSLFRDLQYIAALVPAAVLDNTLEGKAFWDAGLAALMLKEELCKAMVSRANRILEYHLGNSTHRKPSTETSPRLGGDRASKDPTLAQTSLACAARLYAIAALEGDPTAARELALFYLIHPEIVPRLTIPLSQPSEVFRLSATSLGTDRSTRNGPEGKAEERGLDPLTFAVAFHWMEFAANGGDADAKAFLRENGDLGKRW